jgi:hypothetical protein
MNDQIILKHRLKKLLEDHQEAEQAIERLNHTPIPDQLAIQRLKRQKLSLKEQIVAIRGQIIPDIIA